MVRLLSVNVDLSANRSNLWGKIMDNGFNRLASRRRRGQRGFTLIELLVVIAVLAVLAAIVLFNVAGVANRGKTSACSTDQKTFQTAVDSAINDQLTNQGSTASALVAGNPLTAAQVTADLQALDSGSYIHDSAGTTACTSLSFVFINGTDYKGGINVTGS